MVDPKKVIKALRLCLMDFSGYSCEKCPYYNEKSCNGKLLDETLVLLRGEPVRPDCRHAEYDGRGCLGYARDLHDDEPIDVCKGCDAYTGNRGEG